MRNDFYLSSHETRRFGTVEELPRERITINLKCIQDATTRVSRPSEDCHVNADDLGQRIIFNQRPVSVLNWNKFWLRADGGRAIILLNFVCRNQVKVSRTQRCLMWSEATASDLISRFASGADSYTWGQPTTEDSLFFFDSRSSWKSDWWEATNNPVKAELTDRFEFVTLVVSIWVEKLIYPSVDKSVCERSGRLHMILQQVFLIQ